MPPWEGVVRGYYFVSPDTGSPKSYYIPFFGNDANPLDAREIHSYIVARLAAAPTQYRMGQVGTKLAPGGNLFAGAVYFRGTRDLANVVYNIMLEFRRFTHVERPHMEQPPGVAWVYCPWRQHVNPIFRRWIAMSDEDRLPPMSANLRRRGYLGLHHGLSQIQYPGLPAILTEHPHVPARIAVTLDDPLPDDPRTLEENIFWENRISRHAELVLEAANVAMPWIALYRRMRPRTRNDGTLRSPEVCLYCHSERAAMELAQGFAMRTHSNSNEYITAWWMEDPISLDGYRNEIWYQSQVWHSLG